MIKVLIILARQRQYYFFQILIEIGILSVITARFLPKFLFRTLFQPNFSRNCYFTRNAA